MREVNLSVDLGGIKMKNPVATASGTFGYGEEFAPFLDLNKLGAIVVKAITLKPRLGNPPPRLVETVAGVLNAIGLQNVGVEVFLQEKLPYLRRYKTAIIVNIAGEVLEDYVKLAEVLDGVEGVAGLEVNISCPNVRAGGMAFGNSPEMTGQVIKAVREATNLPLIAKLTPNVTDIVAIAKAAEEGGANALSLVNTFLGMAIDIHTRRPKLGNITGGLSGPAIKPIALRMVWQVAGAVKIPLMGIGGISSTQDALEFIIAGARAVAVGTANLFNPRITLEIIDGIRDYLIKANLSDVNELVGSLNI